VGKYRLFVKPSAVEEVESISEKKIRQRLVRAISQLGDQPRPQGSQKLSGRDRYRVRCGPYRIVYAVDDSAATVTVVKVGHRKDVYRGGF
jgi:mRNA interferase RelE/StbE